MKILDNLHQSISHTANQGERLTSFHVTEAELTQTAAEIFHYLVERNFVPAGTQITRQQVKENLLTGDVTIMGVKIRVLRAIKTYGYSRTRNHRWQV